MHSLKNKCYVDLEDNFNLENTGIIFENGTIKVVFPRGYRLSLNDKDLRSDTLLLIKVFEKFTSRKNTESFSKEKKYVSEGKGDKFSLSDAIWLIKDYAANGLYKEYIHRYKTDKKGNIHWARTIKSITPYINNDKLVYLDFIVKEKNNDTNNIILLIQKYIIEKCISIIGWLYPSVQIEGLNKLPYKRSICINILNKELRSTNNDNTKRLLVRMKDFLENSGDEESKNPFKEYKTKYFQNVWEDMLNFVLGSEDTSKYFPRAVWCMADGRSKLASNLMPDTILKLDDKTYVIDAKYYKFGITGNLDHLPQSSDISKQMIYSEYIKTNEDDCVYDSFVLPYNYRDKKFNNESIFQYVGYAKMDINSFNKQKEKKVICILADTKAIMQSYIYGDLLLEYRKDIAGIVDEKSKEDNIKI